MHPHEYKKLRIESGKREQNELIAAKQYGSTEIVARILGVSVSYLNKARMSGEGPPFHKFGRTVRYCIPDVIAWAVSRTRRSTSDPGEAA